MIPLLAAGLGLAAFAGTLSYFGQKTKKHRYYTSLCGPPQVLPTDLVFRGKELDRSATHLHGILLKRHAYYAALSPHLQRRFRRRLSRFMSIKIFVIKDDEAFREMPVLVSAAAIQLTFGLHDYLLPFYRYICLFPEAYNAPHTFYPLAGNVHGTTITVAWSHFLDGYRNSRDGMNVGLHEMSHALYCQKVYIEEGYARKFSTSYDAVIAHCVSLLDGGLPSPFFGFESGTCSQEAWACSVEQFFERPHEFSQAHPAFYDALAVLLQQDPRVPFTLSVQARNIFH